MLELCVGTANRGKQRELVELLADWPCRLTLPQDLGLDLDVEETGRTFAENAAQKALAYAEAAGMPTLADDSGLEVDALGGAPGVYSARYAGPGASDEDRYRKLLAALAETPPERRTARFRCAVAIARPEGQVEIAEGKCEGTITFGPRGEHGFGYDPVFYVPAFDRTMAELPAETKNRVSHRARALQAARPLLDGLCHDAGGEA
jgi:XTP/dITP diphosphohydrolase